jgi:transcriptional regulator with XRE-family HTH domain
LREQRESAQLSLRQLAEMAGVSNPYLSQIERGLKRPSAEILQQIAKGLQVSAESLYVRAGILDERVADHDPVAVPDVLSAIAADPVLTDRQRAVLVDIYLSFVGEDGTTSRSTPRTTPEPAAAPRRRPSRSATADATPELNEKEN